MIDERLFLNLSIEYFDSPVPYEEYEDDIAFWEYEDEDNWGYEEEHYIHLHLNAAQDYLTYQFLLQEI